MRELLREWLLEEPGTVLTALGFLGLVLVLVFRRRGRDVWLWAGLGCWGLAGAVGVTAYLVETEAERLARWTGVLVERTCPLDRKALEEMLGEWFVLTGPWGQVWLERGEALHVLERALARHPIQEQRIQQIKVERVEGNKGEVWFDLVSVFEEEGRGVRTTWRLFWQRSGGKEKWGLAEARWLMLENQEANAAVLSW